MAGYSGAIPLPILLAAVVVFVVIALAWTEYDRYEGDMARRDAEIKDLHQRLYEEQRESLIDPFHRRLVDDLTESEMYGYRELVRRLDRGEGTAAELSAEFDIWDANVARHLKLIDEKEIEFFQRPIEPTLLLVDWRERLRQIAEIRKGRMEAIQTRQTVRLDSETAEWKKKRSERIEAARVSRLSAPHTPKAPNL